MESFRIAFFFCKFIPMRTNAAATGAIGGLTTKFLCQQNQKISISYLILWGVKKLHLIILNCVFVGKRRSSAETISVWRGELESGGLFGKKRGDFAIFFSFSSWMWKTGAKLSTRPPLFLCLFHFSFGSLPEWKKKEGRKTHVYMWDGEEKGTPNAGRLVANSARWHSNRRKEKTPSG